MLGGLLRQKKMIQNRNIQIDLFKSFAIIAIVFLHAGLIPKWSFIWAIPLFVFSTAALYYRSLERVSLKKIVLNAVWIFGLIIFFTATLYFFSVQQIGIWQNMSISPKFWIMRNPYLGNLWYFILYFQILIFFVVVKFLKIRPEMFKGWQWGIFLFLTGEFFSYFLLWKFSKGLSFNFFSWIFLLWLGLVYYKEISDFFYILYQKKKRFFCLLNISAILLISTVLFIGSNSYLNFLSLRTHDFIFPTFILQFCYFILIFSITAMMILLWPKLANIIAKIGKYSLYIYLFHILMAKIIFSQFGIWGFVFSIPCAIIVGYFLEKLRIKILKI